MSYSFADLGELTEVLRNWQNQCDDIGEDGTRLHMASSVQSPAADVVTTDYFATLSDVFSRFTLHNEEMLAYTHSHVSKLAASKDQMADVERGNAAKFSQREGV